MWLKSATLVGFNPKHKFDPTKPASAPFVPTLSSQFESYGFSPVRDGEHYVSNNTAALMRFTTEKKVIPSSAVNLLLEERCRELEKQQGFAPGKKARRELKERIVDELLPRALVVRRHTNIMVDFGNACILIESTSDATVRLVQRELVALYPDLGLQDVKWPRAARMTQFLEDEPKGFTLDDKVTLAYSQGKVVSYRQTQLHAADVQAHVTAGATVRSLAMTYDDRLSFVINDNGQLRGIRPLDVVKESAREIANDADRFDNEFALASMELSRLVYFIGEAA